MACAGCSSNTKDGGAPGGCQSHGHCSTGGCNRLNTYDWLAAMDIEDIEPFHIVEVSFKNGARKGFYYNQPYTRANTGDLVVVETQAGADVGRVTLSGELVRFQMRKKRVPEDGFFPKIIRKTNERDQEKYQEVRDMELPVMVRARAIARTLDINMKISDVEYQGDGRKATFYYTADGRVDFRELIRHYAKEFKIKIEMRQIGARQESARVGGLGPCGRELCCSTWLTSYRTVSTAAARYQNLAINQAKLSGQCGRLKCCLNYELDTYMEALSNFPEDAEKLKTKMGIAVLVKTDIFKGLMYYAYEHDHGRGRMYTLDLEQVRSARALNRKGEFPNDLADLQVVETISENQEYDYADVTGAVELPPEERNKRKKNRNRGRGDKDRPRDANKPPKDKDRSRPPRNKDRDKDKGPGREQQAKDQGPGSEQQQAKEGGSNPPQSKDGNKKSGRNRGRGRGRDNRGGRGRGKGGDGNKPDNDNSNKDKN